MDLRKPVAYRLFRFVMTNSGPPKQDRPLILRTLAQNVRALRDAFVWTRNRLATYAGVKPQMIKNIEAKRANPGASTLLRLANAFGISFQDLFEESLPQRLPRIQSQRDRYGDPEQLSTKIGPRIASLRARRGWGRRTLAAKSGLSKSMLFYLESGRSEPSITYVEIIANTLGVSLAEIVTATDSIVLAVGSRKKTRADETKDDRFPSTLRDERYGVCVQWSEVTLDGDRRIVLPLCGPRSRAVLCALQGRVQVESSLGDVLIECGTVAILSNEAPLVCHAADGEPAHLICVVIRKNADKAKD